MNMEIISRNEAKVNGLLYYYTGKPCKHGHTSKRSVTDWGCYECRKISTRRHARANSETIRSKDKQYKKQHKDKLAIYQKQYMATYRQTNGDKIKEIHRRWRKNNKGKVLAETRRRQANKLQATPVWYEKESVETLYEESQQLSQLTGVPHEVDHIIPLTNPDVCGLHCLANLQIIPALVNRQKGNALLQTLC